MAETSKIFWVGKAYMSGQAFEDEVAHYEKTTKYTFGKGRSTSMANYCRKNNSTKKYNEENVFSKFPMYDYTMACSQGGVFVSKGQGIRDIKSGKVNCQVKLTARFDVKKKLMIIKNWYGTHNHDPIFKKRKKKTELSKINNDQLSVPSNENDGEADNLIDADNYSHDGEEKKKNYKVEDLLRKIKTNILSDKKISNRKINHLEILHKDLQNCISDSSEDENNIVRPNQAVEKLTTTSEAKTEHAEDIDINDIPIVLVDKDVNTNIDIINLQPSTSRGRPKLKNRPPVGFQHLKFVKILHVEKENQSPAATALTVSTARSEDTKILDCSTVCLPIIPTTTSSIEPEINDDVIQSPAGSPVDVQSTNTNHDAVPYVFDALPEINGYFEAPALRTLKTAIKRKISKGSWTCESCKKLIKEEIEASTMCDDCWYWFHNKCEAVPKKLRKSIKWYCKNAALSN
ncbi:uncharacterized protein LOC141525648 [Cotesia typhae]|uniref:uncharacterized protein LOC141525648 n=1 Tax=Cotesia typhae TaxID=2053667 RepID=UPI003D6851F5